MAGATTWNNGSTTYTLPQPDKEGIRVRTVSLSVSRRALSGRLGVDLRPSYKRITLPWPMLTAAEYAAWETANENCADVPSVLTLADGRYWTVMSAHLDVEEAQTYDYDDNPYYTVEQTFEEVL